MEQIFKNYYRKKSVRLERSVSTSWKNRGDDNLDIDDLNRFVVSAKPKVLTNWWMYADARDRILIDKARRYEALATDLASIASGLGLPADAPLPTAKTTYRKNRDHYSRVLGQGGTSPNRTMPPDAGELESFGYRWESA